MHILLSICRDSVWIFARFHRSFSVDSPAPREPLFKFCMANWNTATDDGATRSPSWLWKAPSRSRRHYKTVFTDSAARDRTLRMCLLTLRLLSIWSPYTSVRKSEEQKYHFIFSWTDFTASSDSDEVLSAGDMEYNLFVLNTTVYEDLSNKSAQSTHPRHFPPFFSSLVIFLVSGNSGSVTHVKQSRERGCIATRWHSISFDFPLLCLKHRCEDNARVLLRTFYFWCSSHDVHSLVSRDNLLLCTQTFTQISGN